MKQLFTVTATAAILSLGIISCTEQLSPISTTEEEMLYDSKAKPAAPIAPVGPSRVKPNVAIQFFTGLSDSGINDTSTLFRFNWGDGSAFSAWSKSSAASHKWKSEGRFEIKAQAKKRNQISLWSNASILNCSKKDSTIVPPDTVVVPPDTVVVPPDTVVVPPDTVVVPPDTVVVPPDTVVVPPDTVVVPPDTVVVPPDTVVVPPDTVVVPPDTVVVPPDTVVVPPDTVVVPPDTIVIIDTFSIPAPKVPTGPSSLKIGTKGTFAVTGAVSGVQYRFMGGDSLKTTPWSSTTKVSFTWYTAGKSSVKVQARKAGKTSVWSQPLVIRITR